MSEFVLQKNPSLGLADLGLLATVGPRTIHVYDKLCVVVLSTDSGKLVICGIIYNNETSAVQTIQFYHPIIHSNRFIDPRPEYICVIIIEWSIKTSIPVAHIVSPDTQRSLLSARRCESLDGYSQQAD
ncbi:unnamed protein product [Rotaria magnacalcarata]|uniref:Uncharacterized protein n=2 Tax=Rotaria magnacalcarata TaxID=392030 RepID=A0A816WY14_9BILA|nr:unnamed protein product [Rotaria magnacalcarata]